MSDLDLGKFGVPVRIFALIKNSEDEILVSDSGALPAQDFVAGKDFATNVFDCIQSAGVSGGEVKLAAVARTFGKAEKSCMAAAFWVDGVSGDAAGGWSWLGKAAALDKLKEFENSLVDNTFRARPSVWVQ